MGSTNEHVEDILEQRRLTNDFRWATKTWAPCPSFVRGRRKDAKEIIQIVLGSDTVKNVIREICQKEGRSESEVQKQAQSIITELSHDFHLYAVRWFAVMLSKISKRLYLSIQVNTEKLEQIKEALLSYPVILLPTHRSYVDFLLVSFMFFHYNLPLPITAAGMDFMGMAGIGELLRRSGAFFIRRKFGGDVLYWAIVSEYVKKCALHGGHPVEMFVEGTRSRSGKAIPPKIGLLSATLEMVRNADVPDALILPISMSYDRTLEDNLYAHELLGQPKPKESTNGLVKALRWLSNQSFGSIYVNFGDIISVREYLDKDRFSIPRENGMFSKNVQDIALESILQHQKHLMVPIFPLIATVILSKISREEPTIEFEVLMRHLHSLQQILQSRNNQVGFPNAKESFDQNVCLILRVHSSLVMIDSNKNNLLTPVLNPNVTVQFMRFQHYSNQLLPLIIPCSLVATLWSNTNNLSAGQDEQEQIVSSAQIFTDYVYLRELLQEDFPYQRGTELEEMTWAINTLNNVITSKNFGTQALGLLDIMRSAVEPYLIAYWGMTKTLLDVSSRTKDPCEMKQLGKMCQDFIHHQMKTTSHLPKQYGALSLETLSNAILSSVQSLATAKVKLEDGSFGIVIRDNQQLSTTLSRLGEIGEMSGLRKVMTPDVQHPAINILTRILKKKLLGVDGPLLNTKRHSMEPNFPIEEEEEEDSSQQKQEREEHQQIQLRSKL